MMNMLPDKNDRGMKDVAQNGRFIFFRGLFYLEYSMTATFLQLYVVN
jgi:hypothetical protein